MAADLILSQAFVVELLSATIRLATPILFAALGEIIGERSGVMNLGVEGIMLMGAITSFTTAYFSGDVWLGLLVGMVAGALMGSLMAFMSVTLCTDQSIGGIAIWILGMGLSSYLYRTIFGILPVGPSIEGFKPISLPVLSEIPIVGPSVFRQNVLVYLMVPLVVLTSAVLFRTTLGLKIRAVGERPRVADSLGINVTYVRYICVIFGSMMAGLAGASVTLGDIHTFRDNITAGRGWIAIALVIFGAWKPYNALAGALLFGGADAVQMRIQALGFNIPYQFLLMLPYSLAIIALLRVYKRTTAPESLGIPYRPEGKTLWRFRLIHRKE